jgi:hypothetical protein
MAFLPMTAWAQAPAESVVGPQWVEASFSNDIFNVLNHSDQYYTNGLRLHVSFAGLEKSPVRHILLFGNAPTTQHYLSLEQDMYTPSDLYTIDVVYGDRPYASTLQLAEGARYVNPDSRIFVQSEFAVGYLGKSSGGQYIQNFIHSLTPYSDSVYGWENQISTDLILQYNLQVEHGIVTTPYLNWYGMARAEVGTLTDAFYGGSGLAVGWFESPYQSADRWLGKNWGIQLYGEARGGYSFYNATLQGGAFAKPPGQYIIQESEIIPGRISTELGLRASYKNAEIRLGRIWNNAEFVGAENHAWGYITLRWLIP